MKVARFFMWLLAVLNIAGLIALAVMSTPDTAYLDNLEPIDTSVYTETAAVTKANIVKINSRMSSLARNVAAIQEYLDSKTPEVTPADDESGTDEQPGDDTVTPSESSDVTPTDPGSDSTAAGIDVDHILEEIKSSMNGVMTYSTVTMPAVTRSFSSTSTDEEIINAIIARLTAESNDGCKYYRVEYAGRETDSSGDYKYIFRLYFS